MIGKEIVAQKPVSLVEVKEMLKKRGTPSELTYEQKTTLEYAKKFAKLSKAKEQKLLGELQALGLEDDLAIKIVDVLPSELEVLKIMAHKTSKASEEDLKKALEIVKKYLK